MYSKYEPEWMKITYPITWEKAKGCYVWDNNGKKYIDLSCGIFVTNTGHSNSVIKIALKEQIDKDMIFSFGYPTEIRKKFIDKLGSMIQPHLNQIALFSTGSEVTDKAIQIARKYTGKHEIAHIEGCFHGNNAEHNKIYKDGKYKLSFPVDLPIRFPERDFNKDVRNWNPDEIAAFILEGYQGWSAYFYQKRYLSQLEDWCRKNNIILIMDEVQSGFKRTGPLFCYEHYGIHPDVVCCGKAISGNLPLAAILGRKEIMDCMDNEKFASTHSNNTLVLAAAYANLCEIDRIDSEKVEELGRFMMYKVRKLKYDYPRWIKFVTPSDARGLVCAIHFHKPIYADRVCRRAIENGLMMIKTNKRTIKIGPPLIIDDSTLLEGLHILDKSIKEELGD